MVQYFTLPSLIAHFGVYTPAGRLGMPQDIAGLILFLASPASAHVTGAHLIVDGGSALAAGGIAPQVKL